MRRVVIQLAACLTFAALCVPQYALGQPGGFPPPKVYVEPLRETDVSEGQTFVGSIRPMRRSTVGSAAAGRVEQFLVNEGDRVAKGQPIAKLRTGIIQAELDNAKAALRAREAELGELEAGFRPDEIEQARASVDEAEALFEMRRLNRQRTEALGVAATKRQQDEDASMFRQSEASLRNARATLRLLEEGPRKEKIAQAAALVAAQQAEVERLSEQLDRHTMFAPFDGFVTSEFTEIGHWLMQGDQVAEIVELDQVDVEIPVLENFISGVSLNEVARVEVTALPECVFTGKVAAVIPQADARSRTFPVRIRVANTVDDAGPQLKVGMFARVTLAVGPPVKALLAPKDAIVLGGPAPILYVVTPAAGETPSSVRAVPVQLGVSSEDRIQVIGDLNAGDLIVVEGNERLRPGQPVRPEPRPGAGGEAGSRASAAAGS
ncbi:MAG: efflux RND transporter periplasmic adaptor subunit [Planctomyces sp.]|nr:efflux RND transporter periplasmic adaptor subunit [Planctomyces sp.]